MRSGCLTYCAIVVAATVLAISLQSCKSQKPIVVTAHSDSTAISVHDSSAILSSDRETNTTEKQMDSVSVERWHTDVMRGDSVVAKKDSIVRIHTIYRDRYIGSTLATHDTIRIRDIDTLTVYRDFPIEVPVVQTVEVEKPQSQFLRNSGIALWVLIGIAILAIVAGIILKFAK